MKNNLMKKIIGRRLGVVTRIVQNLVGSWLLVELSQSMISTIAFHKKYLHTEKYLPTRSVCPCGDSSSTFYQF